MYGVMWSLNIPLDIRFFAIASRLTGFMKLYVIEFFAYAVSNLSNYLVSQKRIEVSRYRFSSLELLSVPLI